MPLFITEYSEIARDLAANLMPLPKEPPVAEKVVSIGGSSVQSAVLAAATRFVRVHPDVNCHIAVGTNPIASTSSRRLAAGQTEFIHVPSENGEAIRIAVIAGA